MIVDELLVNECQAAEARQIVWFVDATIEKSPMVVSNFLVPEASGNFCDARRALRRALLEREHGAGVLRQACLRDVLQCRRARDRHPQSVSAQGSRLLHPVDHRGDRQALHQGRRPGPLQDRDPEQQRGDRRPRLHLRGGSRQHRAAHSGGDRRGDGRLRGCRSSRVSRTRCSASAVHRRCGTPVVSRDRNRGPGSAMHHFVLHCARDTLSSPPRQTHPDRA